MPRASLLPVFAALLALAMWPQARAAPPSGEPPAQTTDADAQDPASTLADAQDPPPGPDAAPSPDPRRQRAARIRALIDGTLDVDIDPAALLHIDLSDPELVGPDGQRLRALLEEPPPPARTPARRRRGRSAPPEPATSPPSPTDALTEALRAYLTLSDEQRRAVLDAHAQRRAEAIAQRDASARMKARHAAVTEQAERLEAFLEGTLDVALDPRPLLAVDLTDEREVGSSAERRRAWSAPPDPAPSPETPPERPAVAAPSEAAKDPPPPPASPSRAPGEPSTPEDQDPEHALRRAEARLDALRRRFLALPEPERAARFDLHERRRKEAEQLRAQAEAEQRAQAEAEAAAEQAQAERVSLGVDASAEISSAEEEAEAAAVEQARALEEARLARTEATRILAEERARLLSIKKEQALLSAEINRRKAERVKNHDRALEWRIRATALSDSARFGHEREQEADAMFQGVRAELGAARLRLREQLRHIREPARDVPVVGPGLDRDLADDIERGEIVDLREELRANERELIALEREVSWELAQGLRDDVVLLNRTRLALLDMVSPSLYDEVTGFGPPGLDQVRRELEQISVELGFHLLKLPRYKDILLERLQGSPFTVAAGVLRLCLVLLGLWWWRRAWPRVLKRMRHLLVRRRPVPKAAQASLIGLWYLDRIRRPLEWLIALAIVLSFVGDVDDFPELVLLWIIVRWVLIGMIVILLMDAIAARDTLGRRRRAGADTSALRIHSLRVVGINVIAVGLILSLTVATVGRGAIYGWVISTCWMLSVPVALYLVHRWRPIIAERLAQHPTQGPVVTWARQQQTGWIRFAAATVAAAYLLVHGLGRWFMRHLGGLETTRRLLAYLFRREVTKRAAATARGQQTFARVDPDCYQTFDPEYFERAPLEAVGKRELERLVTHVEQPRSTLSAMVAERGMGKTSMLRRLERRLGPERIKVISCPEIGLDGLMQRIAVLTGDRECAGPALADALRDMGPLVIAIDDAQRLIQPAVRGLRELDRLTAFARQVDGEISWVIAIDSTAWHYVQRARGNRVFFELVVELPRWTEQQLGELIRSRCREATIDPDFDGLVVPRTVEPLAEPDDDQRTEAGYYRLLWDYSRGNPAVTLHAFRESLFVGPQQRIVVRLFQHPPAKEIEALSLTLLFVLRATVQLDLAREHELVAATHLPAADVSDALRFCLARGYIERYDAGVRVAWPWFRTITAVLQRQHLLSVS